MTIKTRIRRYVMIVYNNNIKCVYNVILKKDIIIILKAKSIEDVMSVTYNNIEMCVNNVI